MRPPSHLDIFFPYIAIYIHLHNIRLCKKVDLLKSRKIDLNGKSIKFDPQVTRFNISNI